MRALRLSAVLLAVLLCSGCVSEGLAFRIDDRLTIISPEDREEVTLPVKLRWEIEDFEVVPPGTEVRAGAGFFAVFMDRTPMPPGEDLAWLVRGDESCQRAEGCPDEEYLERLGVYTTTDTELVIDRLQPDNDASGGERHTATIVLLDGAGERIGESAFEVIFDVDRSDQ